MDRWRVLLYDAADKGGTIGIDNNTINMFSILCFAMVVSYNFIISSAILD